MNFLLIIKVISEVLPLIRATVDALNKAIPEPGNGELKFKLALQLVSDTLQDMEGVGEQLEALTPIISKLIRGVADTVKLLK